MAWLVFVIGISLRLVELLMVICSTYAYASRAYNLVWWSWPPRCTIILRLWHQLHGLSFVSTTRTRRACSLTLDDVLVQEVLIELSLLWFIHKLIEVAVRIEGTDSIRNPSL